jgi:Domain of Unknown Function (DUF1080)
VADYSAPVGAVARRASSRHLLGVVTLFAAIAVGASPDAPGAFDPALKPRRAAPALQAIGYDRAPLGTPWLDRTGYEPWWSLHDGFGVTRVVQTASGSRGMRLSTAAALTPSTTYSALVRTTWTWGDLDFTIRLRTLAQRRHGQPNPWEVAWLLWRYTDNDHFYSFIVKPNGFELAKQDPAYPGRQRFLVYAYAPTFPVGPWYEVRVRHVGDRMTVWVDGVRRASYVDRERPYGSGSIALYAEDSTVLYGPVRLNPLAR